MHLDKTQALAAVASLLGKAARGDGHLGAAAAHHLASGGAAWRADLALDCAGVLGLPQGIGVRLAAAFGMVSELPRTAGLVRFFAARVRGAAAGQACRAC